MASPTGIGASVRRVEDNRFITGQGTYTDDINRPGQSYGCFVRSPHAAAKINKVDAKKALAMPGVLAVLTGADMAKDQVGGLPCGWLVKARAGARRRRCGRGRLCAAQGGRPRRRGARQRRAAGS
jgi:carbon-monoxide dehydrogenase large subunit